MVRRRFKPVRRLGCLILIAGLCIAAYFALDFFRGWTGEGPTEKDRTVVIAEGSTLTPAPTVAWSGRERTSSLTLKLNIGPWVVAAVTVDPPCCATAGTAAIRASPVAIAASICFVISFSCEPVILLRTGFRSEEHTSELQSLMRISYAVFCLKKKNNTHYK